MKSFSLQPVVHKQFRCWMYPGSAYFYVYCIKARIVASSVSRPGLATWNPCSLNWFFWTALWCWRSKNQPWKEIFKYENMFPHCNTAAFISVGHLVFLPYNDSWYEHVFKYVSFLQDCNHLNEPQTSVTVQTLSSKLHSNFFWDHKLCKQIIILAEPHTGRSANDFVFLNNLAQLWSQMSD